MISAQTMLFVERFEGFRSKPYKLYGVWAIGYGHTIPVYRRLIVDKKQAARMLKSDLSKVQSSIEKSVNNAKFTTYELTALDDFVYNVGIGNWYKSTMLKLIRRKEFKLASRQFIRWSYTCGRWNAGLYKRRLSESLMFLGKLQ